MSDQAIVNPVELMAFANELERYINTLEEATNSLSSVFARLGETWKDGQRAAFEERYKELLSIQYSFREATEGEIPGLRQKAKIAAEYLGIQL